MSKRRRPSRKRRGRPAGLPGARGNFLPPGRAGLGAALADSGCATFLLAVALLVLGMVLAARTGQFWWLLLAAPALVLRFLDTRESTRSNRADLAATARRAWRRWRRGRKG